MREDARIKVTCDYCPETITVIINDCFDGEPVDCAIITDEALEESEWHVIYNKTTNQLKDKCHACVKKELNNETQKESLK